MLKVACRTSNLLLNTLACRNKAGKEDNLVAKRTCGLRRGPLGCEDVRRGLFPNKEDYKIANSFSGLLQRGICAVL